MKKNKRHLYKKLPKYALGTMKPMDLGYLRGMIGSSAKFDTEQNMSLEPETQAIRKSALPNALGHITQLTPYITEMLKSSKEAATTTNLSTSTLPVKALNVSETLPKTLLWNPSYTVPGIAHTIDSTGSTITNAATGGFSYNFSLDTIDALSKYVGESAVKEPVKQGVKSAGTSTLGTAMGAVGTALGAYTMLNQIADFGSHRSGPDMMANVGRQHVTTDMGNSYMNYNGVNAGQELAYERANARSKQLGFGMNAIGTGASLGGMLASAGALGSIGGPLGTALGAGVGLLLGGLGSLLGWGDNEEEVRKQISMTNDNIAMYNRQQRAVAESKDTAAEFSDRVGTAALGKEEGGNMGKRLNVNANKLQPVFGEEGWEIDYPGSMVMPGELIINGKGKNRKYAMVPKTGNKKDDSTDSIPSKTRPGDPRIVVRQDLAPLVKNVLDGNYPEDFKDWYVAQAENLLSEERYNNMKKYKNGKLPGFWRGTDYLMSAIPHIAALGSSWNLYNRAKYADMPDYPNIVDSSANTKAINILGERKYNVDPVLDNIHKNYKQYLYNISHSGAPAGQQAIERANAFIKRNEAQTQAITQADEINNRYVADYANALSNYGRWMSEMMTNNNYARAAFRQQLNAAKEGWMAQYLKNGLTALADLASDIMGVRQFNRSEDYQNKMLKLYGQQVKNDKTNAEAALAAAQQAYLDRQEAYRNAAKEAAEKANPVFANYGLFAPNNINNLYGMLDASLGAPTIKRYSWMK